MPKRIVMTRTLLPLLALAALSVACTRSNARAAAEAAEPAASDATATVAEPAPAETADGGERFGDVVFDKVVHNFGDILTTDGPQTCSFTVTNQGEKPIAIYEVVSSCGCTDVSWTKAPIRQGQSGTITATFDNKDGAFPFDKTLTVYVSGIKKPVILHLRGVVREKAVPLAEAYPIRAAGGRLGLRDTEMHVGNILQGQTRSDEMLVANLSDTPLEVSFGTVSEGLFLSVSPSPIPPHRTATLRASVVSSRERWGKQWYEADIAGGGKIRVFGYTMEDFSSWSDLDKAEAAFPDVDESTVDFGVVAAGTVVEHDYIIRNTGKRELVLHAVDADKSGARCSGIDRPVPAGGEARLHVRYDTAGEPSGENLLVVTLTTNAPRRPLLNLFFAGAVK